MNGGVRIESKPVPVDPLANNLNHPPSENPSGQSGGCAIPSYVFANITNYYAEKRAANESHDAWKDKISAKLKAVETRKGALKAQGGEAYSSERKTLNGRAQDLKSRMKSGTKSHAERLKAIESKIEYFGSQKQKREELLAHRHPGQPKVEADSAKEDLKGKQEAPESFVEASSSGATTEAAPKRSSVEVHVDTDPSLARRASIDEGTPSSRKGSVEKRSSVDEGSPSSRKGSVEKRSSVDEGSPSSRKGSVEKQPSSDEGTSSSRSSAEKLTEVKREEVSTDEGASSSGSSAAEEISKTPKKSRKEKVKKEQASDSFITKAKERIKSTIDLVLHRKPVEPKPPIEIRVFDAKNRAIPPAPLLPGIERYNNNYVYGPSELRDSYVIAAKTNTELFLEYIKEKFSFNSFDNNFHHCWSVIHVNILNAFFDGDKMVYGNGDAEKDEECKYFRPFVFFLGIAGHEMGHGVVGDKLAYQGQSGAINEAIADFIGICLEMFVYNKKPSEHHWKMGVDKDGNGIMPFKNKETGKKEYYPIRDMEHPGTAYNLKAQGKDPQGTNYQQRYIGNDDNGGVHINSGFINSVFCYVCKQMDDFLPLLLLIIDFLYNTKFDPNITIPQFAQSLIALAKQREDEFNAKLATASDEDKEKIAASAAQYKTLQETLTTGWENVGVPLV